MKSSIVKVIQGAVAAGLAAALAFSVTATAALPSAAPATIKIAVSSIQREVPADVSAALAALPRAELTGKGSDGLPTFVVGELGRVGSFPSGDYSVVERALGSRLKPVLAAFRLEPSALTLRRTNTDAQGNRHLRYGQIHEGLDVIGGDLVVHIDRKGVIYAVNGSARGGLPGHLGSADIGEEAALESLRAEPDYRTTKIEAGRMVYVTDTDGGMYKAYELVATGTRGQDPVRDFVYVDADSGKIVAVHPKVYFAENRQIYSANNGTSLPGTLKRSEGQAATGDVDVNAAYDNTGATYEAYKTFWNRDSYNNAGATLKSSVHYDVNYCNAYWNSTQMVYGDGDSSQGCYPLARAVDVTAHELTHAVTENESNLTYNGESGGLNEAYSDIFGAFTEAWVDGGKSGTTLAVSSDTWLVGEDILPPALRYMNDPAADGSSLDYWTSTAGARDVHYSSGIANLAFYLLSQGGTHPRGKSSIVVTGVGMTKAIRIFYEAQINILTSSSKFLDAGNAAVLAAQNLGYSTADQVSVANAWQAVGVAVPTPGSGGGTTTTPLTNGVPVTGLSDSTGGKKYFSLVVPSGQASLSFSISGGTGDADLYVKLGSAPTTSSYDCRPYKSGNSETCTFTNPAAGTYYVMLNAYASYSGVTLTGTYSAAANDGVPVLTNGVAVTVSGAKSSAQYWKIQTPAGKALTISISGGTGDADLYTKFGSKPTTTSYDCRPYTTGNNETCTVASTQAGYYYVMLRGYAAYSGVSLKASY